MREYVLKENSDGTKITLGEVQDILLEIMVEFDRIATKYDIDYALAFGSELGAIRHNGFIPWDDDIDIYMEYEQYLKLVEALKTDLKAPYYFQCFETDDRYNVLTPTMKIKIDNTYIKEKTLLKNRLKKDGLFIDIFLFDSISESKFKHNCAHLVSAAIMPFIVLLDLLRIDSRFFTKLLYKHARRYSDKNKDSEYGFQSISWVWDGIKNTRIKKSDVFPSRPHQFENHTFRVSRNSDKVLSKKYGKNYMTPPPKELQKPHHIEDIEIER